MTDVEQQVLHHLTGMELRGEVEKLRDNDGNLSRTWQWLVYDCCYDFLDWRRELGKLLRRAHLRG
jgi:hypothetical protein